MSFFFDKLDPTRSRKKGSESREPLLSGEDDWPRQFGSREDAANHYDGWATNAAAPSSQDGDELSKEAAETRRSFFSSLYDSCSSSYLEGGDDDDAYVRAEGGGDDAAAGGNELPGKAQKEAARMVKHSSSLGEDVYIFEPNSFWQKIKSLTQNSFEIIVVIVIFLLTLYQPSLVAAGFLVWSHALLIPSSFPVDARLRWGIVI